MTQLGVDYSFGRPGGAALAAAGKHFAIRYVPYPGDGGKGLTRPELADLQGHGIAVALVFESAKGRVRQGRAAGHTDGFLAANAIAALGFPRGTPVYFAVDFDASKADQPLIDAYLTGAATVLDKAQVGVYGSLDVIERCAENSTARWFWQTYAWSGGLVSRKANVLQYHNGQTINGAAVDFCRSLTDDFGQWIPLPETDTGADVAISTSGLTLTSDYEITLPAGSDVLESPGGAKIGDFGGTFDYFGIAGGYKAVRVNPAGTRGSVIGYTASAATPVKKPPVPALNCDAAVNAALDHVATAHDAEGVAISEARPR